MFKFILALSLVASAFSNIIYPFNTTNKPLNSSEVTQFTISDCGDSSDLAQNLFLDIDPKLPQTDYTLFLGADLSKEITKGTSQYDITLNFIPFTPTINDLCTEISNSNITCPLQVGHIASQSKGSIPTGVNGIVVIKNQWFDDSGARILCMQFKITL